MIKELIVHEWKSKTRSPFWNKSLIINILLSFFIILFVLDLVLMAFFIDDILTEFFPDTDIILKFTQILFYYFVLDLVARFFMQQIPALSIKPYLHLPISKNKIFHYLMAKSSLSLFNWFPLILILPFTFKIIFASKGIIFGTSWLLTIIFLIFSNNFIVFFLKKKFILKPAMVIGIYAGIIAIFYLDSNKYIFISQYFQKGMFFISENAFLLIIPFAIVSLAYISSFNLMKKYSYLDAIQTKTKKNNSKEFNALSNFGTIGNLIQLEMKMIWRGKRSKSFLFLTLFFMIYGLMMYSKPNLPEYNGLLLALGIVFSFAFTMQYVQLLFAWESPFFDFINTQKINTEDYLNAKYYLLITANIICFIVSSPYAFFYSKILLYNSVALIFNIGVNIFLQFYFATWNKSRVDNSKGAFFNHEGIHLIQYIIIIPLVGLPVLIFYPFHNMGYTNIGLFVVAGIGVLGILLKNKIITQIANQLKKKKYAMLTGFRK